MRPHSRGFTLIELVAVIVILAALAAIALPKFTDLSAKARSRAAFTVVSAITTATANNAAAKAAGSPGAVLINQTNVCSRAVLEPLVVGGIPSNLSFLGPNSCATFNKTVNCTMGDSNGPIADTYFGNVVAVVHCAR